MGPNDIVVLCATFSPKGPLKLTNHNRVNSITSTSLRFIFLNSLMAQPDTNVIYCHLFPLGILHRSYLQRSLSTYCPIDRLTLLLYEPVTPHDHLRALSGHQFSAC